MTLDSSINSFISCNPDLELVHGITLWRVCFFIFLKLICFNSKSEYGEQPICSGVQDPASEIIRET